ncbi:putative beta-lysine N-acetyltransferase [Eubacteriaceae bacterium ES2]|nr:putative beta-lysine N-acetyltransferase [Eubacteriaceae bacterium ES2]
MKPDSIIKTKDMLYQHGKSSNRIYIMNIDQAAENIAINELEKLAVENHYTKIIAKVPRNLSPLFESYQFKREAFVPDFYQSGEDCFFMSKYYNENRIKPEYPEKIDAVLHLAKSKKIDRSSIQNQFTVKRLRQKHVDDMITLFTKVFASYPFPIFDPNYLLSTFDEVFYFGFFDQQKLIACASCETDFLNGNAEMTDFAVLPEYRGQKLAVKLLMEMEIYMQKKEIRTLYTIARALSTSMNCTFGKMGYSYGGTLYNNTQISGSIESMNVWYKNLALHTSGY